MRLTSAQVNETATESPVKRYIILHFNNRHDLLSFPGTFSDLETQVKRLCNIERGEFYVEVDGFRRCPGTRVRIPEEAWADSVRLLQAEDDIGQSRGNHTPQVLGNFYVVPILSKNGSLERISRGSERDMVKNGTLSLHEPFEDGKVLVIKVHEFDGEVPPTLSTKFDLRLLDEHQSVALRISIFPKSEWSFVTTPNSKKNLSFSSKEFFSSYTQEHLFIVRKEGSDFHIFCDFRPFTAIQGPSSETPLTELKYTLGEDSPFKDPISAAVYPNLLRSLEASSMYRSMFPLDSETLYQQILHCDGNDMTYLSEVLSALRIEPNRTSCPIKWSNHSIGGGWTDLQWNFRDLFLLVIRFTLPQDTIRVSPEDSYGTLRLIDQSRYLYVEVQSTNARITEGMQGGHPFGSGGGSQSSIHRPPPNHPLKEHTIAFIRKQDRLQVVFDFCKSYTLDWAWIPEKIKFDPDSNCFVDAGVYDFYE